MEKTTCQTAWKLRTFEAAMFILFVYGLGKLLYYEIFH
jgi:hypothetical protein